PASRTTTWCPSARSPRWASCSKASPLERCQQRSTSRSRSRATQAQKELQMSDLKDFVIAAHGGLDRWSQLSEGRAHLLVGGVLWPLKKQDGVLNDSMVRVELHRQFVSQSALGNYGLHTSFTAGRVAIETTGGQLVAERSDPRAAFNGHV